MVRRFLMGNEAFAHAALAAGCGLFAGYPGTPSSEVIETVARLHQDGSAQDIHVEWSTNEKAALEVAAAASLSGVRSLVTCKQVGLNVASDALMSLNYVGVKGGLVILVADDPGPISSQTEQDTRRFAAFAKVPVFDPATPEQGAAMIGHAFEMSERYRTPVIFRPTTRIDHASTFFDFPEATHPRPALGDGFNRNPADYVIFPPRAYQAHGEINERLNAISHDLMYDPDLMPFNPLFVRTGAGGFQLETDREQAPAPAKLGIVTGGVSTQYAREALRILHQRAARSGHPLPPLRLLQVGTPYPFPRRVASRALKDLTDVLVLEELDSVIEEELQKMANASFLWPRVHGKLSDEANTRGENSTEDAVMRISAFLEAYAEEAAAEGAASDAPAVTRVATVASPFAYPGELPARPAVLCAGCPHRASFLAIKRALKRLGIKREDAVFAGDIGCYTLGNAAPLDAVDTCLCMGGGITMAQGIAATNAGKKAIAFVGDSTFFASGMTGVVNAAYNGHDVTICVLDNATTAMTGLQPHPGTGLTLRGERRAPVSIKAVLEASNIQKIVEADPLDPDAAEEAALQALEFEGPSVIIFKSPCVWTQPFGIPAKVNSSKCTGCKKCVAQVGCPAIGFELGARGAKSGKRGQAVIDAAQCNGCGLCLPVCPVDAISQVPELEPQPVRQSRLNRDVAPSVEDAFGPETAEELDALVALDAEASQDAEWWEEDAFAAGGSADPAPGLATEAPGVTLAHERLSGIRSRVPIIPMNPYAADDEFERDDLYEAMTARHPHANVATSAVRRVIKPAGERRYFMKDAIQRSAAAAVFAYTALGEASQAAQIALTAGERAAAASSKRRQGSPDYGGNSELSLDALFSSDEDAPAHEAAKGAGRESRAAEEPAGRTRHEPDEPLDELELSFDGVQLDWDDEAPAGHRTRGRSSERNLRRVAPAEEVPAHEERAADAEADAERERERQRRAARKARQARAAERADAEPPVTGPQGSLIPQGRPAEAPRAQTRSRSQAPRSSETRPVRSRFADYGRRSDGNGPQQGGRS